MLAWLVVMFEPEGKTSDAPFMTFHVPPVSVVPDNWAIGMFRVETKSRVPESTSTVPVL